ncbi:sulfite exporter TauE/SafE family protein [Ignavibacterium sp.]|uniref:sulfite exporter TauE/SafE family protein n=1 Tax=Ignavibacterium sp. TaxID=2651167 RepID=UPI00307F4252
MQYIIILILTGLIAGVMSGFLGIGGGIIVIPALVYLLDFSQKQAQGTSLAMLLPPIGLLAAYNYYKAGLVEVKAAIILIIAFIVGSYFSSLIAVNLPENILKKVFGVLLLFYAFKLFFEK